jgi:hypothetical protein
VSARLIGGKVKISGRDAIYVALQQKAGYRRAKREGAADSRPPPKEKQNDQFAV